MIIAPAHKLEFIQEYYFSRKLREVRAMIAAGKPVLNLGIGNPDQPPADEVISTLQNSAAKAGNHGYQSYNGIPELRTAMADWYATAYGVKLDAETEILPLLGSKEGITHIHNAFLNPGDRVLIPNPGYPTYAAAARLAGAIPVSFKLDAANGWAPNFDDLSEEVLDEAKIMWINYPNMPTGAAGNNELFSEIIKIAKRHQILVVNDNPYSMVLPGNGAISILQVPDASEVAIELNSLSKSHNLAGARVGMLCGQADYIQTVLKVKSNVDSGMYLPVQEGAVAAMKLPMSWHDDRNAVYASRKALALSIMDALSCQYDANQVGMFIWAKIPDTFEDVEQLTEKVLHEANVFITPGFIFGTEGARYIRISLCSPEGMLKEALERVKKLEW